MTSSPTPDVDADVGADLDADLHADVVVVGAGIVGLATARDLLATDPGLDVVVIDKEGSIAAHQSGHNSGVVHAGVYYRPDSLKARLVASGRRELEAYLDERAIPYQRCGKVVVATEPSELARLGELARRGAAHGVAATWLDRRALARREPHVAGLAALHVPSTGVVDFGTVCESFAGDVRDGGGEIRLGCALTGARDDGTHLRLAVSAAGREHTWRARTLVTCAGLQADTVADLAGARPQGLRIAPFRGEYQALTPAADHLVRSLVYPVPDPRFPFLGVHLTRGIDGRVHVGPSALPALAREGYRWGAVDPAEAASWFTGADSRRLARRYGAMALGEVVRSLSPAAFLRAVRRLVPEVRATDLVPAGSGVRAQALAADGTLVDDFVFGDGPRVVTVLNAPSPAATASIAIGRHIADQVRTKLAG